MLDYKLYTPTEWRIADCIQPEDIQVLVTVQVREFYRRHASHRGRSGSFAHYAAAIERVIAAIQECAWREQEEGVKLGESDSATVSMIVARVMFGKDAAALTQVRKALAANAKSREFRIEHQRDAEYVPPMLHAVMRDMPRDERRH